jgi:hypothetical protein
MGLQLLASFPLLASCKLNLATAAAALLAHSLNTVNTYEKVLYLEKSRIL